MEDKNTTTKKESVPIWEKYALLWIGTKVEIKRELFEKFLNEINAL